MLNGLLCTGHVALGLPVLFGQSWIIEILISVHEHTQGFQLQFEPHQGHIDCLKHLHGDGDDDFDFRDLVLIRERDIQIEGVFLLVEIFLGFVVAVRLGSDPGAEARCLCVYCEVHCLESSIEDGIRYYTIIDRASTLVSGKDSEPRKN